MPLKLRLLALLRRAAKVVLLAIQSGPADATRCLREIDEQTGDRSWKPGIQRDLAEIIAALSEPGAYTRQRRDYFLPFRGRGQDAG